MNQNETNPSDSEAIDYTEFNNQGRFVEYLVDSEESVIKREVGVILRKIADKEDYRRAGTVALGISGVMIKLKYSLRGKPDVDRDSIESKLELLEELYEEADALSKTTPEIQTAPVESATIKAEGAAELSLPPFRNFIDDHMTGFVGHLKIRDRNDFSPLIEAAATQEIINGCINLKNLVDGDTQNEEELVGAIQTIIRGFGRFGETQHSGTVRENIEDLKTLMFRMRRVYEGTVELARVAQDAEMPDLSSSLIRLSSAVEQSGNYVSRKYTALAHR